jgi:hypothetical protein
LKHINISFILPSGHTSQCELLHLISSSAVIPIFETEKVVCNPIKRASGIINTAKNKDHVPVQAYNSCNTKKPQQICEKHKI